MKEKIIEAQMKLELLKKSDEIQRQLDLNKEIEESKIKEQIEREKAVKYAEEIFNLIPQKIEEALKKRESKIILYGYNINRNHNSPCYPPSLFQETVVNTLKKLLNKEKITYKFESSYNDDSGFYGSDSIGNPSYWIEYRLSIDLG